MEPIEYDCFCCGCKVPFGGGRYGGRHVRGYDITVCKACYSGNWDGWGPHCEEKLLRHLEEKGIKVPAKNREGWLPRDYPA